MTGGSLPRSSWQPVLGTRSSGTYYRWHSCHSSSQQRQFMTAKAVHDIKGSSWQQRQFMSDSKGSSWQQRKFLTAKAVHDSKCSSWQQRQFMTAITVHDSKANAWQQVSVFLTTWLPVAGHPRVPGQPQQPCPGQEEDIGTTWVTCFTQGCNKDKYSIKTIITQP